MLKAHEIVKLDNNIAVVIYVRFPDESNTHEQGINHINQVRLDAEWRPEVLSL